MFRLFDCVLIRALRVRPVHRVRGVVGNGDIETGLNVLRLFALRFRLSQSRVPLLCETAGVIVILAEVLTGNLIVLVRLFSRFLVSLRRPFRKFDSLLFVADRFGFHLRTILVFPFRDFRLFLRNPQLPLRTGVSLFVATARGDIRFHLPLHFEDSGLSLCREHPQFRPLQSSPLLRQPVELVEKFVGGSARRVERFGAVFENGCLYLCHPLCDLLRHFVRLAHNLFGFFLCFLREVADSRPDSRYSRADWSERHSRRRDGGHRPCRSRTRPFEHPERRRNSRYRPDTLLDIRRKLGKLRVCFLHEVPNAVRGGLQSRPCRVLCANDILNYAIHCASFPSLWSIEKRTCARLFVAASSSSFIRGRLLPFIASANWFCLWYV